MIKEPPKSRDDPQRIRGDQPAQLREWANRLGVSASELQRIVAEVGYDADKVRAYLNTRD